MRETPAEKLIHLLRNAGAEVSYHDPFVPEFDGMTLGARSSRRTTTASPSSPTTPAIDYGDVVERGHVIVDFRNATKGHEIDGKVWKL